ncbi:unnamed protein product [Linum tenue]|uniref:Uncharacterized protein n=1 Tax=Linum tenue TaxID=586396 RepID=A0AAV0PUW4_9ROSI|nr:unnamed protein product [Linum tenue]
MARITNIQQWLHGSMSCLREIEMCHFPMSIERVTSVQTV